MLTLTEDARTAVNSLIATADARQEAGVRIASATGLDGAAASLTVTVAPAPEPQDQIVQDGPARVFLDPSAAQVLQDVTLDAQVDPEARQIEFFIA